MGEHDTLARPNGETPVSTRDRIVIVSRQRHGHRGDYEDFLAGLFDVEVARGGLHLFDKRPVLFLMIEEFGARYYASAIGRALLGRTTVGLLFRGADAVKATTARLGLKRALLRLLKRIEHIRTISIVPFPVEPAIAEVADDWIYDFQLWDRPQLASAQDGKADRRPFLDRLREAGAHSRLLISLGWQDENKGIGFLGRQTPGMIKAGWTPVVAGPVAPDMKGRAAAIAAAGGIVEDGFVSEEDLLAAYRTVDLVWCVYHPQYDQASGIFGRAVQAGVPVAVREGSISHRFCQAEGIAHVAIAWSNGAPAEVHIPAELGSARRSGAGELIERFRAQSLDTLRAALRPAEG